MSGTKTESHDNKCKTSKTNKCLVSVGLPLASFPSHQTMLSEALVQQWSPFFVLVPLQHCPLIARYPVSWST